MRLLPVSHQRQQQQADCLAACAAIVLNYWHIPLAYNRILSLLRVDPIGTPFRNLSSLESANLAVMITEGDMSEMAHHLQEGIPVIAAVDTGQLPYWSEATNHAVVVIGVGDTSVHLLDPDTEPEIHVVSLSEFELAWLEKDYLCAVIRPRIQTTQ